MYVGEKMNWQVYFDFCRRCVSKNRLQQVAQASAMCNILKQVTSVSLLTDIVASLHRVGVALLKRVDESHTMNYAGVGSLSFATPLVRSCCNFSFVTSDLVGSLSV